MSTTTIRLPGDLKVRVARAAQRSGKSAHSFILDAIAEKAERAERRDDFLDTAEQRFAELASAGKSIPWTEMRSYLEARVAGKKSPRPRARKLAR